MKTLFTTCLLFLSTFVLSGQEAAPVTAQGMSGLISASDTVSIVIHREPDLNSSGQLAKDGTMSIPLIGAVTLVGRTTSSAESLIEAKFKDGYLVRPQVSVRITQRLVHTVTVNGEVSQPGVFNLPHGQPITLMQVISMAGGSTDVANIKKVSLRRGITGKSYLINLKDIISNKKQDIILQKDDFIYVPEGLF